MNGEPVPLAIAPLRCTMPPMFAAAALLVANGALTQPFCSVRLVKPAADGANDAPSSEVKHCASDSGPWVWMVSSPLG